MFDRIKSLLAGKAMNPDELVRGGKLLADAVAAAPGDAGQLKALLGGPAAPAAAIIAGATGVTALAGDLVVQLGKEGLPGRAAAWALGRLGAQEQLLAAVADGGIDQRDNAYWGLAVLAAAGKATPALAPALHARVAAEIAKAKSGGTGLGEHAVRALAVLGDTKAGELAQAVVDGDRFCDRFELQRIKKAVADGGRHSEAVRLFAAPWIELFADHLYVEPKPAAPAPAPTAAPAPAAKAPTKVPVSDAPPSYDLGAPAAGEEPPLEEEPATGGLPVDWKAFLASPEAAALQPQVRQLAGQLGQLLEQVAQRAVGAQLTDLSRDEFAAMLTQVMPQALPQQHVQMALSPHAMNAYQAMAKFLIRTGAVKDDGLLQGVKLVRQLMTEQIRRAGILDGPDYADPDEKKPSPLIK